MSARARSRVLLALGFAAGAGIWLALASLLWHTDVPSGLDLPDPRLSEQFTAAELDEARDHESFASAVFLLSQLALVAMLILYAARGAVLARESAAGRIGTGLLLAMLGFAFVWLVQLPFTLVELWWERQNDLARVGYAEWILSSWLALGDEFVFVSAAFAIAMSLAIVLPRGWWIPGVAVFTVLTLVFTFVSPYLTPDLRDPEGRELRREAREMTEEVGLAGTKVSVEEVRSYTSAPNAEATGLGPSRRIILWDTLLDGRFVRDEVRFILAHEIAHHTQDHLWESVGWFGLFAAPLGLGIAMVTRRRGGMARPEAVPLALLALILIQLAAQPLANLVSRRMEAEADWVALERTRDPPAARRAFRRFTTVALSDPDPPVWSEALLGSHPTVSDRIAMTEEWARRNGVTMPKRAF